MMKNEIPLDKEQREAACKILFDLMEDILKQLQQVEGAKENDTPVPFPNQMKYKFQQKMEDLRKMSPFFEEFTFPSPYDTETPAKNHLPSGIEHGLSMVKRQVIPYKVIQVIYEFLARMVVYIQNEG